MNREQVRRYLVAGIWALLIAATISLYLFLRRGYYNLFIANKVLADTGLILIGLVLLIGPLSRLYQRFDAWILYRKGLGILGFLLALLHGYISFFLLPKIFPMSGFLTRGLVPFLFGLGSLVVMLWLFVLSFENIAKLMNRKTWWQWQYRGIRLAALFLFLHLVIMKYPGWISWYSQGGGDELARPFLPPGSLLAGAFGFFILFVRLAELLGTRLAGRLTPVLFFLLIVFFGGSLAWGKIKTPTALPLKWQTCQKLPGSKISQTYPPVCVSADGRRATLTR